MEVLVFGLGTKEQFAVDVLSVREIMPIGKLTRIPGASQQVSGCMNVRGQTVPVMDLCKALLKEPNERTSSMAIILDRQEHFALAVSSVDRIMKLNQNQLDSLQKVTSGGLIEGVINDPDGMVQMLDPERIIAKAVA